MCVIMKTKYSIDMKIIFPLLMLIWNELGSSALATQGESKEYFPQKLI